jgi:hypothetical protein
MSDETVSVTLETEDGTDEIDVPVALIEMLGEGNETAATVVGDLAMLGLAQQAHGVVHHAQGDVGQDVEEAEELMMDLFEERFGQTYGEVTGHSH